MMVTIMGSYLFGYHKIEAQYEGSAMWQTLVYHSKIIYCLHLWKQIIYMTCLSRFRYNISYI